jgi:hypothetical protein
MTCGSFAIGGTMWAGQRKQEAQGAITASLDPGVTTLRTAPLWAWS